MDGLGQLTDFWASLERAAGTFVERVGAALPQVLFPESDRERFYRQYGYYPEQQGRMFGVSTQTLLTYALLGGAVYLIVSGLGSSPSRRRR